jgi:hypothetical protein
MCVCVWCVHAFSAFASHDATLCAVIFRASIAKDSVLPYDVDVEKTACELVKDVCSKLAIGSPKSYCLQWKESGEYIEDETLKAQVCSVCVCVCVWVGGCMSGGYMPTHVHVCMTHLYVCMCVCVFFFCKISLSVHSPLTMLRLWHSSSISHASFSLVWQSTANNRWKTPSSVDSASKAARQANHLGSLRKSQCQEGCVSVAHRALGRCGGVIVRCCFMLFSS